jgi:hypothetical protein
MPVIPALRRLRQESHEFKASLGCIVRPCLKNSKVGEKIMERTLRGLPYPLLRGHSISQSQFPITYEGSWWVSKGTPLTSHKNPFGQMSILQWTQDSAEMVMVVTGQPLWVSYHHKHFIAPSPVMHS